MGVKIPEAIRAGVSFRLSVTATAYPAPDWTLKLLVRGPGVIDLEATPDGASHLFEADAVATSAWVPGAHWYELRASDGSELHVVEEGPVSIGADFAGAGAGFDGRGHAQKVLVAIEKVIEGRASIDQQSYQINNRSLSRTPIGDLLKLRALYRAEVARENAAGRGNSLLGRRVVTRF